MARWQQVVSLCGVLLAYQVQVPGAFAERFEVDRADDDPAASACTAEVNDCTLRGAVLAAHADMTQAHTIVIREGQYLLSLRGAGEDEAATGDLDIRTDVQIIGAGARQTVILSSRIDPITDDRVFHVHAGGSLTLRDLAVRSGRSNGGGALRAERDSSARLERLIVSGNEAVDGGGISIDGSLIATESTISGNSATSGGGGLYVGMNAAGIDLRQVTISENSAVTGAGALIDGGEAMLRRSTIASNRASGALPSSGGLQVTDGSVRLAQTLLAHNLSGNLSVNCAGSIVSLGANLSSDLSCAFGEHNDLVNVDPLLGPLDFNEGPTLTHGLLSGSPAIDARGSPEDEHEGIDGNGDGLARPDIGAFEAPLPTCSPRPAVNVRSVINAAQSLDITITAGRGAISTIEIGDPLQTPQSPVNARFSIIGGPAEISEAARYELPTPSNQIQLLVNATSPGLASTVPLVVYDDCGAWHTVVGAILAASDPASESVSRDGPATQRSPTIDRSSVPIARETAGATPMATLVSSPPTPAAALIATPQTVGSPAVSPAAAAGTRAAPAIQATPGLTLLHVDTSPPLRSITPVMQRAPTLGQGRERTIRRRALFDAPGEAKRSDQLERGSAPAQRMPNPLITFPGVSASQAGFFAPPDINGDVGPNHYVQWVNTAFAIYNKSGVMQHTNPFPGNALWTGVGGDCETRNDGDPIVLYDRQADRWFLSQFTTNSPYLQCMAVSISGDPLGTYYRYVYQWSLTKFNDYPKFGIWPDGYYVSVNQFVGNTFAGAGVAAFERDQMLLGQAAQSRYFDLEATQPSSGGLLPSHMTGSTPPPTGAPNYFVEIADPSLGYAGEGLQIFKFQVNWTTPGAFTFTGPTLLATSPFDPNLCFPSQVCIPQKDTTDRLDALADRAMYRLHYRNFGTHETLVLNHSVDENGANHAGIRWYELRKNGPNWGLQQQGTYAPDAAHRWMGSANIDRDGNIAIGYSTSSSTTYPSIRFAGRLAADPINTLGQGEALFFAGTGSQLLSSNRWGDYSSLSIDPTDDCTFWLTHQYYESNSSFDWKTRIGSFKFPTCGTAPPPPACQPNRPPVQVAVAPQSPGVLSVTVTAGAGVIHSIQFLNTSSVQIPNPNAVVDIGTMTNMTGAWTYTPPLASPSQSFTVRRAASGVATTLPLVVTDGCGAFQTFVGGGAGAF